MHHAAVEILLLLLLGVASGALAHRLQLPYTLALVLAGVALGFLEPDQIEAFELSADLLFTFLLPALLFEASLHLELRDLRRDAGAVFLLAVPGVLVSAIVTAGVVWLALVPTALAPQLGAAGALLFGATIAATDPISVLALFRKLGVDKRLYVLVEGESLLNDGVAVVLFLIVAAVFGVDLGRPAVSLDGPADVAVYGIRTFVWMVGGGSLVGAALGGAASVALRWFDDHLFETTLTMVVAYGSFLVAEEIGCSGVLSTLAAGVVTGSFGARYGMSTRTRLAVEHFWEYAAFVANTLVFLLVGIELQIGPLLSDALPVVAAFLATLVGRAVAVYAAIPLTGRLGPAVPRRWAHVLWWGGLRGSLSMVLVLGLPHTLPGRELLVHLVFGTVSASLFLQGLTVSRLLGWLGEQGARTQADHGLDLGRARLVAVDRALSALLDLQREGVVSPPTAERVRAWYEARRDGVERDLAAVVGGAEDLRGRELADALARLADCEREAVRAAWRAELVGEHAMEAVLGDLDGRVEALARARADGPTAVAALLATNPPE